MAEKKSILEEALLDIKNIQNALNANTKEILRSVAMEEIDSVVKESLKKEGVYEEEDMKESSDKMEEGEMEDESTKKVVGEIESGIKMDELASVEEELDMTSASDDEIISVYKKLSDNDEIEIVGDEIHLTVSEPGEYVIKTSDFEAEEEPETEMGDEEGEEDEVEYDIEMGDEEEEEEEEESEEEEEESEEEEEEGAIEEKISIGTGMSVGTHRAEGPKSIGAPENPKSKVNETIQAAKKIVSETAVKYNTLLTESKKLKAENEEFRKALKEFRTKLVETVVFNSNLTYVTRLFMEHATTKAEKQTIIKRFDDEVTSLKESKKLYKTIASELENRKPINEAVENKIIKEATTSSSKQLNENTAYVDPSTKRILDLIKRVENK